MNVAETAYRRHLHRVCPARLAVWPLMLECIPCPLNLVHRSTEAYFARLAVKKQVGGTDAESAYVYRCVNVEPYMVFVYLPTRRLVVTSGTATVLLAGG